MEKIVRKKIRLDKHDYGSIGAYFLTICVDKHKNILWKKSTEMTSCNDILLPLSDYGIIVNEAIKQIAVHYPDVYVDKYVIMPNHLHLILIIGASDSDCKSRNVSSIVNQLKGAVTKKSVFQYGRNHIMIILYVVKMIIMKYVIILKIIRINGMNVTVESFGRPMTAPTM